jgi:hypothetical protein
VDAVPLHCVVLCRPKAATAPESMPGCRCRHTTQGLSHVAHPRWRSVF